MPIYEYECEKCGNTFEEIVSSFTNDTLPCPKCKSKKTRKLMSRVGGIAMGKISSGPACSSGHACPGANSCGAGNCCPGMS
ncbi:MAG TPA: zinc ribbon domain-containing protein [Chitinivibrionales bacterium]|nr:zinc ribbon domain-containing protein [Chitinivibrionales bacterium]